MIIVECLDNIASHEEDEINNHTAQVKFRFFFSSFVRFT